MNLKKSDKIIAVVGVIVLIVAAVGIIAFAPGDGDDNNVTNEEKLKDYEIKWEKKNTVVKEELFVDKDGLVESDFSFSPFSNMPVVITNVEVSISWEDDLTLGVVLKNRDGEDTITAVITVDGKTLNHEATGTGNQTESFSINSIPLDYTIEDVETIEDAMDQIEADYSNKDTVTYGHEITWTKGEKPFNLRPGKTLNFFKDKGNDVTIEYTFEYYQADFTEIEDDDTKDTSYQGDQISEDVRNTVRSLDYSGYKGFC